MKLRLIWAVAIFSVSLPSSFAETIVVSSLTDEFSPGTLRHALVHAEDGDIIVFESHLNGGTISLSGDPLPAVSDVTIDASPLPLGITIAGDVTGDGPSPDDSRVFLVLSGRTVTMRSLTITGGRAKDGSNMAFGTGEHGGGILNHGILTLYRCTISHNRAGDGKPVSSPSFPAGGIGGGIYSPEGQLTLVECTVAHNNCGNGDGDANGGYGGAIASEGPLILRKCTLNNNLAGNAGVTGRGDGGNGGAIHARASVYMEQCTLFANQAGNGGDGSNSSSPGDGGDGGAVWSSEEITLKNCTIVENHAGDGTGDGGVSGGIVRFSSDKPLTIANTILAANRGGESTGSGSDSPANNFFRDDDVTILGVNIIDDNTLPDGEASTVFPFGDYVGTKAQPLDIQLGAPAFNGGTTETVLPLPGSLPIDPVGGDSFSEFTADQRGLSRVSNSVVDVGAVEANYIEQTLRAAKRASLSRKIRKLKKKLKRAKRKKRVRKVKSYKKKIKKLKKQYRKL